MKNPSPTLLRPSSPLQPLRPCHAAAALTIAVATLTGCATAPQGVQYGQDPRDPFESYNRGMHNFNDKLDRAILKPAATAYSKAVPPLAQKGVSNFFGNLGDAWSFVNNALQLKGEATMSSFFRVAVNSTFGLGGLLDVASEMRLERYRQDFGMTLGHWGVPTGPYLVLPLLGPSTVRDSAALPVDMYGNPLSQLSPDSHRYALYGLRVINGRAGLLRASSLLDTAALDPYSMTRDVYLNMRNNQGASDGTLAEDYDDDADGYIPPEAEEDAPASNRQ